MKYYFENIGSERCYTKDYFVELMKEIGIKEMQVYPAKIITGGSLAWCFEADKPIETGRACGCGKECEFYKPRNGKNGRCRFSKNCYEPEEKPILIKK